MPTPPADPTLIRELAGVLARSARAIAFTGAGISTASGIPDFRGPQGIWTKIDPRDFTLSKYVEDAEHRARVWQMRLERHSVTYEPNDGHRALAELEAAGMLTCVVTQNVDGLHQQAGSHVVLELHGNPRTVRCLTCEAPSPAEEILARVAAGERDPACALCGGILKSATISFGEAMPADVVEDAFLRASEAEVCLVVGSSLVVHPAADIPALAKRAGAYLAIVNEEPTPLDAYADAVIRADASQILRAVVTEARRARGAAT